MRQTESSIAMHLLRGAVRIASLPFSLPALALRRARISSGARAQSAERAKFDTRKWNAELLKRLEWRRFEEMCAAYFEALGFETRITASHSGGGVDIALCAEGSRFPSILVHCKAWDAYRVGIKPLRELRAAMTAAGLREGMLVTSGRFTQEAVAFAGKENIQAIDGAGLLAKLAELAPEKSLALLKLATQGDFLTPTCPSCSLKMTSRKSTQGGRKFWGCANYPRCKQTFSGAAPA
jgi:restriction system protein